MSIRDIYNRPTIADKDWKFTFGKYRGCSLEFVMDLDPCYIIFCQNKIDWFDVSYDILEQVDGLRDEAFEAFTKGI